MGVRILVVDDRAPARRAARRLLERCGYEVDEADGGRAALLRMARSLPDAVVLDLARPAADGWTTLRRVRELADVPVLVLARAAPAPGRPGGSRAGARDGDPVTPSGGEALVSLLDVLVRRAGPPVATPGYVDGWLALGPGGRVAVRGTPVALTPVQARVLGALAGSAGRPVAVGDLARAGWGPAASSAPGQVTVAVALLRAALGPGPEGGSPIETLRGLGYRYVPPAAGDPARRARAGGGAAGG